MLILVRYVFAQIISICIFLRDLGPVCSCPEMSNGEKLELPLEDPHSLKSHDLFSAAANGRKEEVSKWLSMGVKWDAHIDNVS